MYRNVQASMGRRKGIRTRMSVRLARAYQAGGFAKVLELMGLELAREALGEPEQHARRAAGEVRRQQAGRVGVVREE